ncbi:MAG: tRNA (adenosine(37)-N6)-threonylcarbamoyltransferase complex dimerization subunit type 1 TsaB, partial [Candidatus Nanopelagicales bacterium]
MLVLAIDTATEATSVAVVDDTVRVECHVVEGRRHAEVIAPLIRQALREAGVAPADIALVACGVGPGPFTGLRVGIATALAFGAARDIPV